MKNFTTADKIASLLNRNGRRMATDSGATVDELCTESGGTLSSIHTVRRQAEHYLFPDNSVIVIANDEMWDFGYPNCFCFESSSGHDPDDCIKMRNFTTAEKIASLLNHNGRKIVTDSGATVNELCEESGGTFSSIHTVHRQAEHYLFPDNSVIVIANDETWDFGYPGCFCSESSSGHDPDDCTKI